MELIEQKKGTGPTRRRRRARKAIPLPNMILRLPAVLAATGLGRTSLYEKMAAGEFPHSVSLGARSVGWRSRDVDAWIDARGV